MADARVTSIFATFQERISSKQYVPSTTYSWAILGATGALNNLFIAFMFSDQNVGVQFLKDVRLIPSSRICCKCGSPMSWFVDSSVKASADGDVWGSYLLPHVMLQLQLCMLLCFSRVIWTLWNLCSSRTTPFTAFLLTLSSKSISLVLQQSLIGPNSVDRSCWTLCWAALRKSAVLTRPSKMTRASSVGTSTIGDSK